MHLRILTHLLGWKRRPSSQSSPFSVIRTISTKKHFAAGCGCSFKLVMLFEMFCTSFDEISLKFSLLVVGRVAIRLVHADVALFLFSEE